MARDYTRLVGVCQVYNGDVTADGNQTARVDAGLKDFVSGYVLVSVPKVAGTAPTTVLKVQGSEDGTTWTDLVTTSAITAATTLIYPVDRFNSRLRVVSTATGGTTPVISVTVTAHALEKHYLPGTGTTIITA